MCAAIRTARGSGPSSGLPRAVLDAVIIDAVVPQICEILLTDGFVDRPGADHIHPSWAASSTQLNG